jgi:Uncharacterized conserved protein
LCILKAAEDFDPVEAVSRYLSNSGFDGRIFHTEETIFTVSDASSAVGAPEEEILKSILLRVNRGEYFALALMSGINRVDTKKIKKSWESPMYLSQIRKSAVTGQDSNLEEFRLLGIPSSQRRCWTKIFLNIPKCGLLPGPITNFSRYPLKS